MTAENGHAYACCVIVFFLIFKSIKHYYKI